MKQPILNTFIISALALAISACGNTSQQNITSNTTGSSTVSSTNNVACDIASKEFISGQNVNQDSVFAWTCASGKRNLSANGIPNHAIGLYPNADDPNAMTPQTVSASMTLNPMYKGTASPVKETGYALNGVKFDPGTGGACNVVNGVTTCSALGSGTWRMEAVKSGFKFGVDDNNAHVQPGGAYHYHGMPEGLLTKLNKGKTMTLVGFAADGFPIYARYGYNNAQDANSGIKVITGSYQFTQVANRPSVKDYPMGTFTKDFQYVAGSGDLDECNGRTGATPEFPKGIYHYFITDTYPYAPRCLKGQFTEKRPDGPPPGGQGGSNGAPPPPM